MQEAWDGEDALKERILGGNSREEKGVCNRKAEWREKGNIPKEEN